MSAHNAPRRPSKEQQASTVKPSAQSPHEGFQAARDKDLAPFSVEEASWFTIAEAERTLGVSPSAFWRWLKTRPRLWRRTRCIGKHRYAPWPLIEQYERETLRACVTRVTEVPPGWLGCNEAAKIAGCDAKTIRNRIYRGELEAVKMVRSYLIEPSGIERLRLELRDRPLPGWVSIRDAAKRVGSHRNRAVEWFRANGHELRLYRSLDNRRCLYGQAKTVAAWEAQHLAKRQLRRVA